MPTKGCSGIVRVAVVVVFGSRHLLVNTYLVYGDKEHLFRFLETILINSFLYNFALDSTILKVKI